MKALLAFALLFLLSNCSEIIDYDAYVISVMWANNNCDATNPDCSEKLAKVPKNTMTIHGLWPGKLDGKKLDACYKDDFQITNTSDPIFLEMEKHWPSFLQENINFWSHEYSKHGVCWMMEDYEESEYETKYVEYFKFVLEKYEEFDFENLFKNMFPRAKGQISIFIDDFRNLLEENFPGQNFRVMCNSNLIKEIYFYYDKNFNVNKKIKFRDSCTNKKPLIIKFN